MLFFNYKTDESIRIFKTNNRINIRNNGYVFLLLYKLKLEKNTKSKY